MRLIPATIWAVCALLLASPLAAQEVDFRTRDTLIYCESEVRTGYTLNTCIDRMMSEHRQVNRLLSRSSRDQYLPDAIQRCVNIHGVRWDRTRRCADEQAIARRDLAHLYSNSTLEPTYRNFAANVCLRDANNDLVRAHRCFAEQH